MCAMQQQGTASVSPIALVYNHVCAAVTGERRMLGLKCARSYLLGVAGTSPADCHTIVWCQAAYNIILSILQSDFPSVDAYCPS